MIDRSKLAALLLLAGAMLTGAVGAQGCNMYTAHNAQHRAADADHTVLQQIAPLVQQLVQIEQQRQRQGQGQQGPPAQ